MEGRRERLCDVTPGQGCWAVLLPPVGREGREQREGGKVSRVRWLEERGQPPASTRAGWVWRGNVVIIKASKYPATR